MQAYGSGFARIYNIRWAGFARHVAPLLRAYYEAQPANGAPRALLDLCCGTGQLALAFLEQGYHVTGLDLSPDMLAFARANAAAYVDSGQARFVEGDAADFRLDAPVGLAVSTFDALNHLPDLGALAGCFASVYRALVAGGVFIFDLNTWRKMIDCNTIHIHDAPDLLLVQRGVYGGGERAWNQITGFLPHGDGPLFERFEETIYETVFALADVRAALETAGFRRVHFAHEQRLDQPVADPETLERAFVIAHR